MGKGKEIKKEEKERDAMKETLNTIGNRTEEGGQAKSQHAKGDRILLAVEREGGGPSTAEGIKKGTRK